MQTNPAMTLEQRVEEMETVLKALLEQQLILTILTEFLSKRLLEEKLITEESWAAYQEQARSQFMAEVQNMAAQELNDIEF